jgi:hypothetical protein
MKKICMVVMVLAAVATSIPGAALAGTVPVSGTHSELEITKTCGQAKGGVPFTDDNGTYGCRTTKGSVSCKNGTCTGTCDNCNPAIAHGKTPVFGVLSGTTLKAGANSTTKTTAQPIHIKTPVAESNAGSASNSETHQGKKK